MANTNASFIRTAQVLYIAAAFLWTSYCFLFPTWAGRSYSSGKVDGRHYQTGGFGLRDSFGMTKQAPVWNPPVPHSLNIHATTRWPWQPLSNFQYGHIAVSMTFTLARWALGLLCVNVAYLVFGWFNRGGEFDSLWPISIALTISLSAVWMCIMLLTVFTMGILPRPTWTVIMLLSALTVGIVVGMGYSMRGMRSQSRKNHASG